MRRSGRGPVATPLGGAGLGGRRLAGVSPGAPRACASTSARGSCRRRSTWRQPRFAPLNDGGLILPFFCSACSACARTRRARRRAPAAAAPRRPARPRRYPARFVVAHRDEFRHRGVGHHAPVDEYVRRRRGHVQVVAFGFVAVQLNREPGMQPTGVLAVFLEEARLARPALVGYDLHGRRGSTAERFGTTLHDRCKRLAGMEQACIGSIRVMRLIMNRHSDPARLMRGPGHQEEQQLRHDRRRHPARRRSPRDALPDVGEMGHHRLQGKVVDALARPLRDLRISVTDRCNLRCGYCMPREVFGPDFPSCSRRAADLRGDRPAGGGLRRVGGREDPPHRWRAACCGGSCRGWWECWLPSQACGISA